MLSAEFGRADNGPRARWAEEKDILEACELALCGNCWARYGHVSSFRKFEFKLGKIRIRDRDRISLGVLERYNCQLMAQVSGL